jgi:hypothetical protein
MWAAKRWSRARLLKLCIQQDNTKELLQALSCRETRNLACLQEVRHRLCCTVLGVDEPKALADSGVAICKLHVYTEHSDDPACAAAWAQLLTQASNVQVVS